MLDQTSITQVIGREVIGSDGSPIGKVGQVYLDDSTGEPSFITVKTGLFGTRESFVPVRDADLDDELRVPYTKEQVKNAPSVESDEHITIDEEERVYAHYGLADDAGWNGGGREQTSGRDMATGYDTSGPTTDEAMTRSEERLRVGTTSEQAGRARLRKYVVTEQETVTVPVRKERAVLETEPITEGNVNSAMSGPAISEEEHEVVLHEERPVVEKTATPVERVRLGTEEIVEERTVTEDVRKEQIEADGDIDVRR
jgi:uncharacterized protein (TIGR02271 family)